MQSDEYCGLRLEMTPDVSPEEFQRVQNNMQCLTENILKYYINNEVKKRILQEKEKNEDFSICISYQLTKGLYLCLKINDENLAFAVYNIFKKELAQQTFVRNFQNFSSSDFQDFQCRWELIISDFIKGESYPRFVAIEQAWKNFEHNKNNIKMRKEQHTHGKIDYL